MKICKHRIMDRCKIDDRPCIFSRDCYEPEEEKTITNVDRIRAMSDEELANLLTDYSNNGGWVTEIGRKICYERIFKWLQQPAEEVNHES